MTEKQTKCRKKHPLGARGANGKRLSCEREKGHDGEHVAAAGTEFHQVWFDPESVDAD